MLVQDLNVFKKAHKFTLEMYKLTSKFPASEQFGLVSQVRRASASINANLLEGNHRNSVKEYKRFISIARGSSGELKYHLLLIKDLNYLSPEDYQVYATEIDQISKMLLALHQSLDT